MDDMSKIWIKNPNVSRGGVSLKFRFRAVSYLSWLGSGWVSGTQNLKLLVPKKIGSSCFHNVGFPGPKKWKLWDQNVLLISFLSHAPVAIHDRHYINGSKIGQHLITNGVYIMFVCLFVCCTQGWQMYTRHLEMEAYDLRSLSQWIWETLNKDSFVNFESWQQFCRSGFWNHFLRSWFCKFEMQNLRPQGLGWFWQEVWLY